MRRTELKANEIYLKYLFSERKKIERKIEKAKSILLVCDFDGTLVSIKSTPNMVHLPPKTKKLLFLLSGDKRYNVGIISGRPLCEVKKLIGLNNIFYVGNHGFEIKLPKRQKFVYPQAKKIRPLIKNLSKKFNKLLSGYNGILIEDKTYTLSIHYRNCLANQIASLKKGARSIYLPLVKKRKVRVTEGKKVIEIRPPLDWDKGEALRWTRNRLKKKNALTIYIGDDRTDEDAFAQTGKGLSIYVGAKKKHSAAKFYLSGPNRVVSFLTFLVKLENDRAKKSN